MRIVVFSDTHGNYAAMHKIFKRNGDADLFIFLGDGESELLKLKSLYIDKEILHVSGNCDAGSLTPESKCYNLANGMRIFYTHGHKWDVRFSYDKVMKKAQKEDCQFALYGHTHKRFYTFKEGVHILNPGSAGCPRDGERACYAFIDIVDAGIICCHVDL